MQPNATDVKNQTPVGQNTPTDESQVLSAAKLQWIDFTATQGLITEADGTTTKMTVMQFAQMVGVNKSTLFRWRDDIPNFWQKVADRVRFFYDGNRTIKVINAIYLNATVKLNPKAQEMWMANQKLIEFRSPTQKVEHEFSGGMADLLNRAREIRQSAENAIEGEVITNVESVND